MANLLDRRSLILAAGAMLAAPSARADERFVRLPVDLVSEAMALDGRINLGAASPDVTMIEFFDYNCSFCRTSARDLPQLLKAEPDLRYVLVNFGVLGEASVLAARVALAFSLQRPERYLDFHLGLFERGGQRGSDEAIDVAVGLGAEEARLIDDANSETVTRAWAQAVKAGDGLGLMMTPSFLMGAEGRLGAFTLAEKREAIANFRRCEAMSCG